MLRVGKNGANSPKVFGLSAVRSDGNSATDGDATCNIHEVVVGHGAVGVKEVVSAHDGRATPPSNGRGSQRLSSSSGRPFAYQLKVVGGLLALSVAVMWGAMAVMYYHFDVVVFGLYRRRSEMDSGAGSGVWVPPPERPVPLSAFPDFSGAGLSPKGKSNSVKREMGELRGGPANVTNTDVAVGAGMGAAGRRPPTLLFMHLWKCAGSSLRHLLRDWAELEEQSIAIVVRCDDVISKDDKICLHQHQLIDPRIQGPITREYHVLAGHFTWGFQAHVRQPYVMFTTLRNPLELFVSGQQYLNRKATRVLGDAVEFVEDAMKHTLKNHRARMAAAGETGSNGGGLVVPEGKGGKAIGYIYRLVEAKGLGKRTLSEAAEAAMRNLDTFWLVGVVEQYGGFMAVLQGMMDPSKRHRALWKNYSVEKYNASPNGAEKVLGAVDPDLVDKFNQTLAQQWEVYNYAVGLFRHRCHQVLHTRDLGLCEAPLPRSTYTPTDLEREILYQQEHPGDSYTPEEMVRAKNLWAEYKTFHSVLVPDSVWKFFESKGFDLTQLAKRKNLWSRLNIKKAFRPGPRPGLEPAAGSERVGSEPLDSERLGSETMMSGLLGSGLLRAASFDVDEEARKEPPGSQTIMSGLLGSELLMSAPIDPSEEVRNVVVVRSDRFGEHEIARAKRLWLDEGREEARGPASSFKGVDADEVVALFEGKGFDLGAEERTKKLWEDLGLKGIFGLPAAEEREKGGGNIDGLKGKGRGEGEEHGGKIEVTGKGEGKTDGGKVEETGKRERKAGGGKDRGDEGQGDGRRDEGERGGGGGVKDGTEGEEEREQAEGDGHKAADEEGETGERNGGGSGKGAGKRGRQGHGEGDGKGVGEGAREREMQREGQGEEEVMGNGGGSSVERERVEGGEGKAEGEGDGEDEGLGEGEERRTGDNDEEEEEKKMEGGGGEGQVEEDEDGGGGGEGQVEDEDGEQQREEAIDGEEEKGTDGEGHGEDEGGEEGRERERDGRVEPKGDGAGEGEGKEDIPGDGERETEGEDGSSPTEATNGTGYVDKGSGGVDVAETSGDNPNETHEDSLEQNHGSVAKEVIGGEDTRADGIAVEFEKGRVAASETDLAASTPELAMSETKILTSDSELAAAPPGAAGAAGAGDVGAGLGFAVIACPCLAFGD
eukprot:jgi/Undpi1/6770/HiC_scaffold_21.g09249.m1